VKVTQASRLVESNPSIFACGKQPKHPCLWKATQASLLVKPLNVPYLLNLFEKLIIKALRK
jgi:hypothetical protein